MLNLAVSTTALGAISGLAALVAVLGVCLVVAVVVIFVLFYVRRRKVTKLAVTPADKAGNKGRV